MIGQIPMLMVTQHAVKNSKRGKTKKANADLTVRI
jgi:hypothetical protein